jgi:hypothetical protein
MANVPKSRRVELVGKAADAAGVALQRLDDLSNSGNPDVAARATAILVLERNEEDDLNVIQQILGNQPASALKPISDPVGFVGGTGKLIRRKDQEQSTH